MLVHVLINLKEKKIPACVNSANVIWFRLIEIKSVNWLVSNLLAKLLFNKINHAAQFNWFP